MRMLRLDCGMLEINPLFKAADDKIIAVDCKMNIDDNALDASS
jgi:succinyl-CoA synthetase beta subunit